MSIIINLGVFQILWFGLLLVGDLFLLPACLWWLVHYRLYASDSERKLLPIFTIAGLTMDQLLTILGVLQFYNQIPILPFWMIGLWVIFPTTLFHGLKWVWSSSIWIPPVAAVGASLNYIIGASLASLTLPLDPFPTTFILTFVWLAYLLLVRRLGRFEIKRVT